MAFGRDPESQPLLENDDDRRNKAKSSYNLNWPRRFGALTGFGLAFLFLYGLVMLPRTSVSRDWRRLHHERLSRAELERELFRSIDRQSVRDFSKKYTSELHLAGENYGLAQWTRGKFEEFGFKSEIPQYDVYINKHKDHAVKLLNNDGSVKFEASLKEAKLAKDPTSNLPDDELSPTYHGYSASGNATSQVIYANLGRKEDYDLLVEKGVDFKGKIVLVRYGGNFRGLKVKFAQELGASAVLIYTDLAEDGDMTEKNGYKVYPDGPARHPSAVQRGSVMFLPDGPGDPTTPGYASKEGVERQDPQHFMPSIPSVPISYSDALPILKELNGKGLGPDSLGKDWKGALDGVEYNVGPSDLEVNVYNSQDYVIRPIYNVVGKLEGIIPNEVVVLGNHRDSWITGGAADPNSGSACMMEIAKALGNLQKQGWKPVRTIVLASWDAEEFGLIGSTEWGEDKAKYIHGNVLAYLNMDTAVGGKNFYAEASPYLNNLIRSVAKRVGAPSDSYETLYGEWNATSGAEIGHLGSGSDYSVFLNHLGVPSADMAFNSGDVVWQYHSNYDSFYWMDTFCDPDWRLHEAATKFWSLLAVSLTEQEVVAFKTAEYGERLTTYISQLEKDLQLQKSNQEERVFESLRDALDRYTKAANKFDKYLDKLQDDFERDYPWFQLPKKIALLAKIKVANAKLFRLERLFLYHKGLTNRPWYKHIVFAPGRYTGYAGQLLPGLTEGVEDRDYKEIEKWGAIIKASIDTASKLLD